MDFINYFKKFADEKVKTLSQKVDSNSLYYNLVMRDMSGFIKNQIMNDKIIVKPAVGQGNYSDVPWICLLSTNASISPSAQKGIYIVLLFSKKGDEFYLTLSQGITNFKNMKLKGKELDRYINNTVNYFQNEMPLDLIEKYGFSKEKMNLGDYISTLAKGYIKTTIISKLYTVEKFDEDDFLSSLHRLVFEYEEIVAHIGNKSYDDIIKIINPQEGIESIDYALEEIHKVLKEEYVESRDVTIVPINVKRGDLKSNKYSKLTEEKIYKKVDYLKQAKEQQQTGLKGEQLALEIEKKRLIELGLNPDEYIKWYSIESDSYGYDFESVDIKEGKIVKIFIEVKSTKDIKDTSFFVSKNQVDKSKIKKDKYRIFRIFDITSIMPKYYYVDGEIEDNFYLDPITFSARYKYDLKEWNEYNRNEKIIIRLIRIIRLSVSRIFFMVKHKIIRIIV